MNSSAQWSGLLQNLGVWQGSFTRLSPQGELQEELLSQLNLEGLDDNRKVRLTLQQRSPTSGEVIQNQQMELTSLSPSLLFFEKGAFSQGSMQYSANAEFGFIWGDRRLRLFELFAPTGPLTRLTLIREHRQGISPDPAPSLTPQALCGTWQGEALILYPDGQTSDPSPT
jgi:hypothetical protein